MPYDEVLAGQVRDLLVDEPDVTERAMFGGLGFMVAGNMAVAAGSGGELMVRAAADEWIDDETVRPMEMRGRPMSGWLLVTLDALSTDDALQQWVDRGVATARSLPAK